MAHFLFELIESHSKDLTVILSFFPLTETRSN